MSITKKELQTSHDYWVANFNEKAKSIDKLCVKSAERLGEIDYQLWRPRVYSGQSATIALKTEKSVLENIIRHFIGFVDIDYVIANDLAPEGIERNKTRKDRSAAIG